MTTTMLGAITVRALSVHGRRALDFLLHEHAVHGGQENGKLAAPHRQLILWGITPRDIPQAFEELTLIGVARMTRHGQWRSKEPSLFALTWLPTHDGAAPTHDWLKVIGRLHEDGIGNVAEAKRWLKAALDERAVVAIRAEAARRKSGN